MEIKSDEAVEEGHLCRLPDELLVYICTRLGDLKSLCICCVALKRFASIIPHVRMIDLTLPRSLAYSKRNCKSMWKLISGIHNVDNGQISAFLDSLSLQKMKLPSFLQKFGALESVRLEQTCSKMVDNSSFLKWKVKCRSDSVVMEKLVTVLASSIVTEHKPYHEETDEELSHEYIHSRLNAFILSTFGRYSEWSCLVCLLIKSLPSLRNVIITDSEKQGKMVIGDEHLARIRASFVDKVGVEKLQPVMKIAFVPCLHLPSSGYLMRGVCLAIFHNASSEGNGDEVNGWDFEEGEEMVLGEVVKEIFRNYSDTVVTVSGSGMNS